MYESPFDQPFDLRVFVNTQCDCPDMGAIGSQPVAKNKCQVIQIGAVLYDVANNKEIASFNESVGPAFEKTTTPFPEEPTGVTQREDEQARTFPDIMNAFTAFCAGYPVWAFDKDQRVLEQNCDYFSIEFPLSQPFIYVKSLLPSWGVDPDEYSSGTLYKAAGLKMDGPIHDALHDARSMAAAVSYFENHETFSTPSA